VSSWIPIVYPVRLRYFAGLEHENLGRHWTGISPIVWTHVRARNVIGGGAFPNADIRGWNYNVFWALSVLVAIACGKDKTTHR